MDIENPGVVIGIGLPLSMCTLVLFHRTRFAPAVGQSDSIYLPLDFQPGNKACCWFKWSCCAQNEPSLYLAPLVNSRVLPDIE